MSDCSTQAMEPRERRTCGTCAHCEPSEWHCDSKESEYSWMVDVDDVDLPCGGYGYERRTDGLAERHERLAQVAREMFCEYRLVIPILASHIGVDYVTRNFVMPDVFIKKLRELGVSVDDM